VGEVVKNDEGKDEEKNQQKSILRFLGPPSLHRSLTVLLFSEVGGQEAATRVKTLWGVGKRLIYLPYVQLHRLSTASPF